MCGEGTLPFSSHQSFVMKDHGSADVSQGRGAWPRYPVSAPLSWPFSCFPVCPPDGTMSFRRPNTLRVTFPDKSLEAPSSMEAHYTSVQRREAGGPSKSHPHRVMGRASLTPGCRPESPHSQPSLLQELLNKTVLLFKQKLTSSEYLLYVPFYQTP